MLIWTLLELKDQAPRRVSLEIAAKAAEFGTARALTFGGSRYSPLPAVAALERKALSDQPELVLIGSTALGRDLAPRFAARMGWSFLADVTALRRDGARFIATRPMYAGRIIAELALPPGPAVLTVRPNAFPLPADAFEPAVETVEPVAEVERLRFLDFVAADGGSSGRPDLAEARVVVSGGRGLGGPENWHLIEDLADALSAAMGASRAAVDAGWRAAEEQVGQTGKIVSPDLYIACGISGAIQHIAGMASSRVIVAVNRDPEAPIFYLADYGIVGDLHDVLPAFAAEIRSERLVPVGALRG